MRDEKTPQDVCGEAMDFKDPFKKRVGKMTFFGLKYFQDLENQAAHLHQEFPAVPPFGSKEQGVNHVIIIIA